MLTLYCVKPPHLVAPAGAVVDAASAFAHLQALPRTAFPASDPGAPKVVSPCSGNAPLDHPWSLNLPPRCDRQVTGRVTGFVTGTTPILTNVYGLCDGCDGLTRGQGGGGAVCPDKLCPGRTVVALPHQPYSYQEMLSPHLSSRLCGLVCPFLVWSMLQLEGGFTPGHDDAPPQLSPLASVQ